MQEIPVQFLGVEDLLGKGSAAHSSIFGLSLWLSWLRISCNVGDLGSIPGLGRSPGEGKGYPLQYSGLENSMDCVIHGGHKESDMTERLSLQFTEPNHCLLTVKSIY